MSRTLPAPRASGSASSNLRAQLGDKTRPLHNVSDAYLADLYGELKPRVKRLADRLEEVLAEFKPRGTTIATGEKFVVVKVTTEYEQLDTKKIRTEMGEAWCAKRTKPGSRTSYVPTPVPPAAP